MNIAVTQHTGNKAKLPSLVDVRFGQPTELRRYDAGINLSAGIQSGKSLIELRLTQRLVNVHRIHHQQPVLFNQAVSLCITP